MSSPHSSSPLSQWSTISGQGRHDFESQALLSHTADETDSRSSSSFSEVHIGVPSTLGWPRNSSTMAPSQKAPTKVLPLPATHKDGGSFIDPRQRAGKGGFLRLALKLVAAVVVIYLAASYVILNYDNVAGSAAIEVDASAISHTTPPEFASVDVSSAGQADLAVDDRVVAALSEENGSSDAQTGPVPPVAIDDAAGADASDRTLTTSGDERLTNGVDAVAGPQQQDADKDSEHGADSDDQQAGESDLGSSLLVSEEESDTGADAAESEVERAIARQKRCDELVDGVNMLNIDSIPADKCKEIEEACAIPSCKAAMDVVVLWVNGSDPNQIRLREETDKLVALDTKLTKEYAVHKKSNSGANRFRDFGQLKIGLRSFEKNIEYGRRIFLVTNNQVPDYVNRHHPRMRIIDHKDLMKWANVKSPYPAMFNSMAIESMIHFIPTLSSPFIYMQDDMFYGVKVPLRLWMDEQGGVARPTWRANMTRTPRDALFYKCAKNSLHALLELGTIPEDKYLNSTRGTLSDHGPTMWFRDVGDKIWELWRPRLEATVAHPYRHQEDMNLQALHMHLGRHMGKYWFKEVALTTFKILTANHDKDVAMFDNLQKNKQYVVCLNDDFPANAPEWAFTMIQERLERFFPDKASFEL